MFYKNSFLKPLGIVLDLSRPGNVGRLVNETIKCYKKIDIVVNSAGIGLFASIKDKSFNEIYEQTKLINEALAVELTYLSIPYLEKTRGSLVLIASILAANPVCANFFFFKCSFSTDVFFRLG